MLVVQNAKNEKFVIYKEFARNKRQHQQSECQTTRMWQKWENRRKTRHCEVTDS